MIRKILKYQLKNSIRSKFVLGYALFYFLCCYTLLHFGSDSRTIALSLSSLILVTIPLVSSIFGALYLYNEVDFIELLLAQPLARNQLFTGLYWGIALPQSIAMLLGIILPFLLYGPIELLLSMAIVSLLLQGLLLTAIFTAFSFILALLTDDKARGVGIAVIVWLLLAVVYDGAVLAFALKYSDYPLEKPLLILSMVNPIDLARISMLMQLDVAALMGYTGAVFERFFGSVRGMIISYFVMLSWLVVAYYAGKAIFIRKDF